MDTKAKRYQLTYIFLNDFETKEFKLLLEDFHCSIDIQELIERERIKFFIHSVLVRYQQEADIILLENNEHNKEKIMHHLERAARNEQVKYTYSSLVRIFRNEMKRKREEVLIKAGR